jgi:serine phosphatase RsbU (regulator of sigma subunit)
MIVRADGRIEQIESTGPVVGILPSPLWRATSRMLGAGDTLVLYSDGVVESTSDDGTEFGTGGIAHAIARARRTARGFAESIVNAVNRHARGRREDDLTLLVIGRS